LDWEWPNPNWDFDQNPGFWKLAWTCLEVKSGYFGVFDLLWMDARCSLSSKCHTLCKCVSEPWDRTKSCRQRQQSRALAFQSFSRRLWPRRLCAPGSILRDSPCSAAEIELIGLHATMKGPLCCKTLQLLCTPSSTLDCLQIAQVGWHRSFPLDSLCRLRLNVE